MRNENTLSNWGNIFQIMTGIVTLAPLISLAFKSIRTWLTIIIRKNAETMVLLVILWLCITIWLIFYVIRNRKRGMSKSELHKDLGISQSSPYILIVDDDLNVLDAFRDKFSGLYANIALLTSLPSSLVANGFDIVISDIANAGYKGKLADDILREMKIRYPYKFICAMSSNLSFNDRAYSIDGFFYKDAKGEYLDKILQAINEYRKKMCKVEERWNEVEAEMKMQKRTETEIAEAKGNYYRSLESLHLWQ